MKTYPSGKFCRSPLRFPVRSAGGTARPLLLALFALAIVISHSRAGSATWSGSSGSTDWNTASNWVPATVPNGPAEIASFSTSSQKSVSLSMGIEVGAIVFKPDAFAFTITHSSDVTLFSMSGAGVTNNSTHTQHFVIGGGDQFNALQFLGTASAGESTVYTANPNGNVSFSESSSAGEAMFLNQSAVVAGSFYGSVTFFEGSSAGNGTFVNEGSTIANSPAGGTFFNGAFAGNGVFTNNGGSGAGAPGGSVQFAGSGSSAENGTFTNNGGIGTGALGGSTTLFENTKAGNATFIANGGINGGEGGSIVLRDSATGDNAEFQVFGNGNLDVSAVINVSINTLKGDGLVKLASSKLSVGANNGSGNFAGTYSGDGTIEKVGSGEFTLSGVKVYFVGPTLVSDGILQVNRDHALGTGDAAVSAGAILRLQDGTANDYLADTATLSLVDDSIVNLKFTGSPDRLLGLTINGVIQDPGVYGSDISGAEHVLPQFTGSGTLLVGPSTKSRLLNISTRLQVQGGDNVLIGGFIITGFGPKNVIIRGIGPSLEKLGVPGVLANPTLQLDNAAGKVIATNDDWKDTQETEIEATGLAPSDDREAAVLQQLQPGAYTAVLQGTGGSTGVGLVEVYDLDDATTNASIANISTRGLVQTGDDVMIGGIILGPEEGGSAGLVVRAIGPSLADSGVANPLQDPVLSAYDSNGMLIAENDNWKDSQENLIDTSALAPNDDRESAILLYFVPGNYTAIVTGKDGGTGVALVEFYNLL